MDNLETICQEMRYICLCWACFQRKWWTFASFFEGLLPHREGLLPHCYFDPLSMLVTKFLGLHVGGTTPRPRTCSFRFPDSTRFPGSGSKVKKSSNFDILLTLNLLSFFNQTWYTTLVLGVLHIPYTCFPDKHSLGPGLVPKSENFIYESISK
jgi:hypothetical protein